MNELKTKKLQIFNEIKERLYNIKQDYGYNYNIKRVEIQRLNAFKPNELPAVNFYITRDRNLQTQFGQETREMTLIFESYTKIWDQSKLHELYFDLEDDITTVINRKKDSINKEDAEDNDLGGIIEFMTYPDISPIITGSEYAGVALEITVNYIIDRDSRQ